jgi:hypothetical protein
MSYSAKILDDLIVAPLVVNPVQMVGGGRLEDH